MHSHATWRRPPIGVADRDAHFSKVHFSKMHFSKVHFSKMHFSKMHFSKMHFSKILQIFGGLVLGCIKTKFCKKICVRQHFQALQDLHTFASLQSQNFSKKNHFEKSTTFVKIQQWIYKYCKFAKCKLNFTKFQKFQLDNLLCSNEAINCGRASPSSRSATISSKEPVSKTLEIQKEEDERAIITNDFWESSEFYQIEGNDVGNLDRCGDYYRECSQCMHCDFCYVCLSVPLF